MRLRIAAAVTGKRWRVFTVLAAGLALTAAGLTAGLGTAHAAGPVPRPAALSGQSFVRQFDPATLAGSAWNPSNQPGNCPTANNGAFVNSSGYAEIDTTGASGDCRSMQSPSANMPTAPGTTYEALVNFSSFHDWPSLWMYGPSWPDQGEIDAVEGGPGASSVTWHQSGNHTIGGDPWDDQQVPFAGGPNIQPGVWTTVDIAFTATGADVYYQGQLYVHIPESVTTGGNDPMYLTISEGSCSAEGVSVCNGGTSPAGNVQVQWVREFSGSGAGTPAPVPTVTPTTPAPSPTATSPSPSPSPAPGGPKCGYTRAPDAAPAGLTSAVPGDSATVTWKGAGQAELYEVDLTLPDGSRWTGNDIVTVPGAAYRVLHGPGRYTVRVRALNGDGTGPWSSAYSFNVTS